MKILGIETSCDETGAAVVEDGRRILANVVASQAALHARYGGIVPELASRKQVEAIIPVVRAALSEARLDREGPSHYVGALARAGQVEWAGLDAVAVVNRPGLAGSLLVGVSVAKAIAFGRSLPLVAVNHLEAHIYANWLEAEVSLSTQPTRAFGPPALPALALVVSGGHSGLILMEGHGAFRTLGRTRDDAAGEAFDKVARLLGLGFPGGPAIERAAAQAQLGPSHTPNPARPEAIPLNTQPTRAPGPSLPRAWLRGSHDFSFSGLKTAVLRLVQQGGWPLPELAAAFQEAVVDVLAAKAIRAAQEQGAACILLAGGVAANSRLRQVLEARSPLPVRAPPAALCTDNGAMVAACGYFRLRSGETAGLNLDVLPGQRIALG
ncbi:MAG TPA: tRNA (adenosine(37)-N6)-threonylcarbamoyltransferase complex transferase subunit TsaD [Dehalococcoidia bacterium]|nr:tRNA (adenosine(37)-N6)-threonylcarbamoyltransferase complex transferase subunit TsaD [Dehalococcoidia bacterium]